MAAKSKNPLSFFPFLNDTSQFIRVIETQLTGKVNLKGTIYEKTEDFEGHLRKFGVILHDEMKFAPKLKKDFTLIHVSNRVTNIGFVLQLPTILEIDPEEEENVAKSKIFNNFWQYCYEKNKVLICLRNLNAEIDSKVMLTRYVELIPTFTDDKGRIFIVKLIPFRNEINPAPTKEPQIFTSSSSSSSKGKEVITKLIEKFTADYDPNNVQQTMNTNDLNEIEEEFEEAFKSIEESLKKRANTGEASTITNKKLKKLTITTPNSQ